MGLVVARRRGEAVVLYSADSRIVVRVIETSDERSKLLLDAPKTVMILREEIDNEPEVKRAG